MLTNRKALRRVACNQLLTETGQLFFQQVVEIRSGRVTAHYPLTQELPQTEWLAGCIELGPDGRDGLHAYHNGRKIE